MQSLDYSCSRILGTLEILPLIGLQIGQHIYCYNGGILVYICHLLKISSDFVFGLHHQKANLRLVFLHKFITFLISGLR